MALTLGLNLGLQVRVVYLPCHPVDKFDNSALGLKTHVNVFNKNQYRFHHRLNTFLYTPLCLEV